MDRIGPLAGGASSRRRPRASAPYTHANVEALRRVLQPGDVLLDRGQQPRLGRDQVPDPVDLVARRALRRQRPRPGHARGEPLCLVEVNLGEGCVAVPLSKYERYNTRICRANDLTPRTAAASSIHGRELGKRYDLKNITDILRFFLPTPPVPVRWRRRLLAFGSGDPTRAICSSLIAEAFGRVRYPILPVITREFRADPGPASSARDPAHPPSLALRAAGLRPLALLPHRQADARVGLRLPTAEMGGSSAAEERRRVAQAGARARRCIDLAREAPISYGDEGLYD